MQTFILDLRLAIRSLRTGRLTTVAAIATMALGIGAATSMYSVVEGVLIHTLPFRDPGSLVDIHPISVQITLRIE